MEIRHLRHFVAVAGKFTSPERLSGLAWNSPQSGIRSAIWRGELGVKLFQRTTSWTWLTRAGLRFYHDASRILRDIDAATAVVRGSNADEPIVIRLAPGKDLTSEPFTRLSFELKHHISKVELEVRELLHTEAARLVRDRAADLAILRRCSKARARW